MKTSNERLLSLIIFYLFYLFFGAFMFDQLESPYEAKILKELNRYVKEFRAIHHKCLTDEELNAFVKLISMANDKGVPATRNVSKEQNWSFGQAVFFAGTVLTTIGYGDVTVQTQLGKVFCILFACVGIPATLLLLYAIIERLMRFTGFLLSLYTDTLHPVLKNTSDKIQRAHMHVFFACTCALFVLVFFFLIPAAVYSHIEGWSYLNSFYYCFISLSTVGLGDYVPGDHVDQKHRHMYKIFSTIYLIVGVMVMVWLLQIFSETPEFNLYKYFTLTKDGILTNHREVVHTASSQSDASYILTGGKLFSGDGEAGRGLDATASSQITYQKQLDETQPSTGSLNPSDNQTNYMSLASIKQTNSAQ